jgi:hypothetical protein
MLSYEVERRMVGADEAHYPYDQLTERRRPLLRFAVSKGRPVDLSVLGLIYPCLTLAEQLDPLALARGLAGRGEPILRKLFQESRSRVSRLLVEATAELPWDRAGPVDERWYWAALALLDQHFVPDCPRTWLIEGDGELAWSSMVEQDGEDGHSRFGEHACIFARFFEEPQGLERQPDDLFDILAQIGLAGPAMAAARALLHCLRTEDAQARVAEQAAAARVGMGFRTLFNRPKSIKLLNTLYRSGAY